MQLLAHTVQSVISNSCNIGIIALPDTLKPETLASGNFDKFGEFNLSK